MEVEEKDLIECIDLDHSGEEESLNNNTSSKKTSPCDQRVENSRVNEQEKSCPISKSFYVVQEDGKQTATVTPTSVIKTMQLSALKDYLHCYRCYATFYKIQDLVQHFLDCTSQRYEDYTFSQFKDDENSKSRQNTNSTSRKMKSRSSSPEETQYKVQKSNPRNRNSLNSSPQKYHHQRQHGSKLLKSSTKSGSPSPVKSIIAVSKQTPLIKINENDARLLLEARMRGDERRKSQRQAQTTTPSRTRLKSKAKDESGTTKEQKKKTTKETLPWRCKKCPLKYSTSRELTQHVNAHDGILPYKCTFEGCDKAFSWKKSRNRHVEQHEKDPNFKPRAPRGPHVKNLKKEKQKEKQKESKVESGDES